MPFPLPEKESCSFCEYVADGQTRSGLRVAIVSERALTIGFVDPWPIQPGHLLVISRRHAPTLLDLTREEAHEVMEHARELSRALVDLLAPEGLNAFQNNGVVAGQSIAHYHLHLVPRRTGDGGTFPAERALLPEPERFAMAARVRAALEAQGRG